MRLGTQKRWWFIVVTAVIAMGGTSQPYLQGQEEKLQAKDKLKPAKLGKVRPLHQLGPIYLAGQPAAEDLKLAKESGVKTVLNLRDKDEIDWDEEAQVKGLGMEYVHLPFRLPQSLTDDIFDQARSVLRDSKRQPLLLHCASANRVGAIWLAHRVLDDGLTYEQALKEARTAGLKAPALEERAKDYIQRKQKP